MLKYTSLPLTRKLQENVSRYYGEQSAMTGEMALRVAAVYFNADDETHADVWYEKTVAILWEAHGKDLYQTCNYALACSKLSRTYRHHADWDMAMQLIEEALAANQGVIATTSGHDHQPQLPYHPCLRQSYFLIDQAKILIRTGKIDAAAEVYRKAWDVLREDADSYRIGTETFDRTEFDRLELELLTACGDFAAAGQKADAMLDYARKWREEGHVYVLDLREQRADILT